MTSHTASRSGLFALLLAVAMLALPVAANASSVTPTQLEGNPTCADINPSWSQLKVDGIPGNQTYSDSNVSVTISNVTANNTFDWAADHSIDAVIVKAADGALLYTYDPESFGDTIVSGPGKYDISHVNFCYDEGDTPPPTCAQANAGSPDTDDDGVVDACDNCPTTMNADQVDTDGNGVGDACEPPVDNPPSNPPADNPPATTPTDSQVTAPTTTSGSGPADPGSQVVLGERIAAVSARLLAPTGCTARSFSARVRGAGIASVVFTVDGKRVKTVRKGGMFVARVNPAKLKVGIHRIVATVKFDPARHQKSRTLRSSFQHCASRFLAPRFTG